MNKSMNKSREKYAEWLLQMKHQQFQHYCFSVLLYNNLIKIRLNFKISCIKNKIL